MRRTPLALSTVLRNGLWAGLVAGLLLVGTQTGWAVADTPDKSGIEQLTADATAIVGNDCSLNAARQAFYADGPFHRGPLYVSVVDTNGNWRIYPPARKLEGKPVLNIADQDGVMIVREILTIATTRGTGWLNYRWLNPDTNQIQDKDTFVQMVPACNLVVVIGRYR